MRELRFRVWDIENKRFEVPYVYSPCMTEKERGNDTFYITYNNDNYIIQQYTGVKDRNKKMIFEGDLVIFDEEVEGREPCSPTHMETSPPYQVFWSEDDNGFMARRSSAYTSYSYRHLPRWSVSLLTLTVVGHINKLMKKKKKA